jgi:hypothetical protein
MLTASIHPGLDRDHSPLTVRQSVTGPMNDIPHLELTVGSTTIDIFFHGDPESTWKSLDSLIDTCTSLKQNMVTHRVNELIGG